MDYSAANTTLWNNILQLGLISFAILIAYYLYRRINILRKTMMPVAVAGGFMLLAARYMGLRLDEALLESVVYHFLALGFIASAFRVTQKDKKAVGDHTGLKSGAIIVSTYLLQGILGLGISLLLSYTLMPGLFRASGMLLPMGFGQGPGQANNVGTMLEGAGFAGGRSYGLSIAAMGYLVACSVGVIMLNVLRRRKAIQLPPESSQETVAENRASSMPVSLDALSLQAAGVIVIYLATYWVTRGLTEGLAVLVPRASGTITSLIWGFNFILGSALAMLARALMQRFSRDTTADTIRHKNEILSRISGVCFDYMVVAGIASIRLEDIRGLWIPFLLTTLLGGILTWLYLSLVCKRVYPDYYSQGLIAMFGMLTGTISSGVLLLREIDPDLSTPAANQLLVGSGFAIILGAPMLVLISIAAQSDLLTWISLGIMLVYFEAMLALILLSGKTRAMKTEEQ